MEFKILFILKKMKSKYPWELVKVKNHMKLISRYAVIVIVAVVVVVVVAFY